MGKPDPQLLSQVSNVYGVNADKLSSKQLKAYEHLEAANYAQMNGGSISEGICALTKKALKADKKNDMVHAELAANYRIKAGADLKKATQVKASIEEKKASLGKKEKLSQDEKRDLKQAGKDIATAEKELGKAKDHAQKALELNPNNLLAQYNLLRLTDPNNETKGLDEITGATAKTLHDHIAKSFAYSVQGQVEEKLQIYRDLGADPQYEDSLTLHFNHGTYLKQAKCWPEAEAAFRKVVELAPDLKTGHNNLGIALFAQQQYKKAEAEFKKALELGPDYFLALEQLGMLKEQTGKYDESIEYRLKLLQQEPDLPDIHHGLAVCYVNKGEFGKAAEYIEGALKIKGDSILFLCSKANILSNLGRDKEALECISEAYRLRDVSDEELNESNQGFVAWIFTEQRAELLGKIKELEKVAEPVIIDESADAPQKEYAKALNDEIALLAPEVQQAAHSAILVMSAQQGDVEAQVGVAQQIIVRIQPVIGKRDVLEVFMAHKASDPHLGDYIHGVSMTLTCTYAAAQGAASGMSIDTDTMLSNAAGIASILPFGGGLFSLLQAGLEVREEIKIKTKFGHYSAYASNQMEASRWAMEVCNKLAEKCGGSILDMNPKKGVVKKLGELLSKLVGDSESYTYGTPWKMLGHIHGSMAVKAMSKKPGNAEIKVQPYDDLPDRIFEFVAGKAFKGQDLTPGIEYMTQEVKVALGNAKVVDLDGDLQ